MLLFPTGLFWQNAFVLTKMRRHFFPTRPETWPTLRHLREDNVKQTRSRDTHRRCVCVRVRLCVCIYAIIRGLIYCLRVNDVLRKLFVTKCLNVFLSSSSSSFGVCCVAGIVLNHWKDGRTGGRNIRYVRQWKLCCARIRLDTASVLLYLVSHLFHYI